MADGFEQTSIVEPVDPFEGDDGEVVAGGDPPPFSGAPEAGVFRPESG